MEDRIGSRELASASGVYDIENVCHIVEHEDNDMMRPFTVTP